MATTLLTRVKSKLFVHSRRRSRNLLEGEFASVFHGRSLDYDDLRDYVPGDEVRDIDWKATARHTSPSCAATWRPGSRTSCSSSTRGAAWPRPPRRRAEEERGNRRGRAVGYLAQRHGDLVGLVRGDATSTVAHPMRRERGPPRAAPARHRRCDDPGRRAEQLTTQLQWIVRNVRRRLLLLIVADDVELDPGLSDLLRRLHVQHEILWITVEDADPTSVDAARTTVDVADHYTLRHWCGRAPASGRPTHRRSPHAFGRPRCSMRRGSTTPESARATRSSRPCSPCWRGSVVRAADSPPPASMRPTPTPGAGSGSASRSLPWSSPGTHGSGGRPAPDPSSSRPGSLPTGSPGSGPTMRARSTWSSRRPRRSHHPTTRSPAGERPRPPLRAGGLGHPCTDDDPDRPHQLGRTPQPVSRVVGVLYPGEFAPRETETVAGAALVAKEVVARWS